MDLSPSRQSTKDRVPEALALFMGLLIMVPLLVGMIFGWIFYYVRKKDCGPFPLPAEHKGPGQVAGGVYHPSFFLRLLQKGPGAVGPGAFPGPTKMT